ASHWNSPSTGTPWGERPPRVTLTARHRALLPLALVPGLDDAFHREDEGLSRVPVRSRPVPDRRCDVQGKIGKEAVVSKSVEVQVVLRLPELGPDEGVQKGSPVDSVLDRTGVGAVRTKFRARRWGVGLEPWTGSSGEAIHVRTDRDRLETKHLNRVQE